MRAGLTGSRRPRCSGPRRPEPGRLARGVGEWRDTCGRWSVSKTLTVSSGDSGGTPGWELPGLRVAPAVKCASAYPKADARRAVGLPPSPASDAPFPIPGQSGCASEARGGCWACQLRSLGSLPDRCRFVPSAPSSRLARAPAPTLVARTQALQELFTSPLCTSRCLNFRRPKARVALPALGGRDRPGSGGIGREVEASGAHARTSP